MNIFLVSVDHTCSSSEGHEFPYHTPSRCTLNLDREAYTAWKNTEHKQVFKWTDTLPFYSSKQIDLSKISVKQTTFGYILSTEDSECATCLMHFFRVNTKFF